jgi:hypothetical protein
MAANLEGKIALVTGDGSGIGRATAPAFSRECARVAIRVSSPPLESSNWIGRGPNYAKSDLRRSFLDWIAPGLVGQFVVLLAILLSTRGAIASDKCLSLLVPDITSLSADQNVRLSFMQLITKEQYEQMKSQKSFGFDLPIADGLTIGGTSDWDDFKTRKSTYLSDQKFGFDESDSLRYLSIHVPESARTDYLKCQREQALSLSIVEASGSTIIFSVKRGVGDIAVPDTRPWKLEWDSSDAKLARLNASSKWNTLRPNGEPQFIYNNYDDQRNFNLDVNALRVEVADAILIPATPVVPPVVLPNCPKIDGVWLREDARHIYAEVVQSGCQISGKLLNAANYHQPLTGSYKDGKFAIIIVRTNMITKCTTKMYANLTVLDQDHFQTQIYHTDGICRLAGCGKTSITH